MLKINHSDVKSDMLSVSSNVREVLRALYFYGPDYIMIKMGGGERLVHKEQLVSLLELGKASATIEDIMSVSLNEPMSARMQLEDIPQDTFLLVFEQKRNGKTGDLSRVTFEEYRENAIKESAVSFPDWWEVPLPLLFMDGERVVLNEQGVRLMPCDAAALAQQAKRMARDRIVTIKEKKHERTFSLRPLEESIYLIEDISGDFEMAEDLVWWAAVGKAFYRRLEENGAVIRRLSPFEKPPENFAEVIPCLWEGELVGSVAVGIPGEAALDEPSESTETLDEPQIEITTADDVPDLSAETTPDAATPAQEADQSAPKPVKRKRTERQAAAPAKEKSETVSEKKRRADIPAKAKKAPGAKKRVRKPNSETIENSTPEVLEALDIEGEESLTMLDIEESLETAGNLVRLNRNAARKAYGGTAVRRVAPEDGQKIKG